MKSTNPRPADPPRCVYHAAVAMLLLAEQSPKTRFHYQKKPVADPFWRYRCRVPGCRFVLQIEKPGPAREQPQPTASAAREPYRTWYGLAAETGLRAGELCGLTVDDLDLERGILQVRQSAWRGILGDPKTNDSIRVVELSPQACGRLKAFLKSWHPNARRLLFPTRTGTPWDQNLMLRRKFRPLLRAIGIEVPRGNEFHAFRHANATLMNSFGASHRLRQQRLGHAAGSSVTEAIYTHVTREDGRRTAAQLGDAVWGISDANGREKGNGLEGASSKPLQIN
ncbi:MAG: tyrosine-type recombinase/integrase [Candidatus Acidiferrales bacterium]